MAGNSAPAEKPRRGLQGLLPRLVTAGVLGPLVVAEILMPSMAPVLAATLLAAVVLAAREWARLTGITLPRQQWLYALAALALAVALHTVLPTGARRLVLAGGVVFGWVGLAAWLVQHSQRLPLPVIGQRWALALGLFVLTPFFLGAMWMKELDARWLLAAALLIWAADSLAYFVGHALGRHRLAPALSPGKTWEGACGALLGAPLITAGICVVMPEMRPKAFALLGLCVATVGISIVGDLLKSLLKRTAGVKDSGTLLPGHGGVLDRIDSLTAAFPMFYLGVSFLGSAA